MKKDWSWFLIFIVIMTSVGFVVFGEFALSLAFGLGAGSIFGLLLIEDES